MFVFEVLQLGDKCLFKASFKCLHNTMITPQTIQACISLFEDSKRIAVQPYEGEPTVDVISDFGSRSNRLR